MLDWLDDVARMLPQMWLWKPYFVALWHTLRKPVKMPMEICKRPKTCKRSHRLAMVTRGKRAHFVLVH